MGIHNLAPVFSALKLGAPASVHASSTPGLRGDAAAGLDRALRVPRPRRHAAGQLHWYDGGLLPPRPAELEAGRELNREDGILFVGDKGKMLVEGWGGESPRLIPESKMQAYQRPPKTLPRSIGHHKEWIEACKDRHAHAVELRLRRPADRGGAAGHGLRPHGRPANSLWDSENLKVTNVPEANQYLHYEYRKGWTL